MRRLALWLAILAFVLSILYAFAPGPYTIAAFAFVGVPFYFVAIVIYIGVVILDLRGRGVV